MEADLDLNSNDILNVNNLEVSTIDADTVDASNFTVDGISINVLLLDWEGPWVISTSYLVGDLVSDNGSTYLATVAHQASEANRPGFGVDWETVWDLVAQKGDTGDGAFPASSTDNAIPRFDGTLGNDLQNSGVIIDDSNNVSGVVNLTLSGTVDGRDVAADGTKLDTIETGAEVNDTAEEIRTKLLTVDGSGSGIDADLLDGLSSAAFTQIGGTDVVVADGGTGVSSLTAYAPIFGGTTTTNPVQSGTVGASGEVLTSNGAGALPTFQPASSGAGDQQTFDSSGTWTKPTGFPSDSIAFIEVWGAGGSGARSHAGNGGGGGGGGSFLSGWMLLSELGSTETVTVGVGGAAITNNDTVGVAGGSSSFGTWMQAFGGGGGGYRLGTASNGGGGGGGGGIFVGGSTAGADSATGATGGGPGGGATAADSTFGGGGGSSGVDGTPGNPGGQSLWGGGGGGGGTSGAASGLAGGASMWGGGGGGGGSVSGESVGPGAGGNSRTGGDGGAGGHSTAGTNGSAPGGGGGGAGAANNSGAGANGRVRVTVLRAN